MKQQLVIQAKLRDISETLKWKEALFRQTEITQEQYKHQTALFEAETRAKEDEISRLQLKVDQLSSELTTSKKVPSSDPANSSVLKQKDKELRDLKKQLSDLSQVVSNAKRDQRVREHDLAKSMALREEIEQCKKERVALEKKQREDAKKYAEERRERELERARALKRERQMQLELQKKDEQIHKQMAALATHRQRERKCDSYCCCIASLQRH